MTRDFKEEPLTRSVYLRTEQNYQGSGDLLSIRSGDCLTPFNLYGHLRFDDDLENPTDSISAILSAERAPYDHFKSGVESLRAFVHDKNRSRSELAMRDIVRNAQKIFFKGQLPRLDLVAAILYNNIPKAEREYEHYQRQSPEFSARAYHNIQAYSDLHLVVTNLQTAVVAAAYSFDTIMIGTNTRLEDKFGKEEPSVPNVLELAVGKLNHLQRMNAETKTVQKLLLHWRTEDRDQLITNALKLGEEIERSLTNARN